MSAHYPTIRSTIGCVVHSFRNIVPGVALGLLLALGAGSSIVITDAASPVPPRVVVTSALDSDGDGLANGDELVGGTDPLRRDTDRDVLNDGKEVSIHGTDPLDADTDDDGLTDGKEVLRYGSDPLVADRDTFMHAPEVDTEAFQRCGRPMVAGAIMLPHAGRTEIRCGIVYA